MNVQFYSREEIEAIIAEGKFPENTAVISIYGSITNPPDLVNYSSVCERVMYIELDDFAFFELEEVGYTYETFFPEADEAAEFIIDAFNAGMNIICECEYGLSRSAGCAAAIGEYFFSDGISVFADYRYYPNKVVYHKLLDALKAYKEKHPEPNKFEIDKCVRLLKYNGTDENVVIPEGVSLIGNRAFEDSAVKSVKIPNSVREIDDRAFSRCGNLEQINIPSSVARFGISTFLLCRNLESIEISPDAYIDHNIFLGTKWEQNYPGDFIIVNGVLIRYKGKQSLVVIPDNVKEIGIYGFYGSEVLKEVVIPKTVERINWVAFEACENLEVITIENPNTEIEHSAFDGCLNLRRIICDGRSVSINISKEDDITEIVKSTMASVRQKNGHE